MFPLETLIFVLIVLAILNYAGPQFGRHFQKADALLSRIIFRGAHTSCLSDVRGCEVRATFGNADGKPLAAFLAISVIN